MHRRRAGASGPPPGVEALLEHSGCVLASTARRQSLRQSPEVVYRSSPVFFVHFDLTSYLVKQPT
jgi:hypothetical protein